MIHMIHTSLKHLSFAILSYLIGYYKWDMELNNTNNRLCLEYNQLFPQVLSHNYSFLFRHSDMRCLLHVTHCCEVPGLLHNSLTLETGIHDFHFCTSYMVEICSVDSRYFGIRQSIRTAPLIKQRWLLNM